MNINEYRKNRNKTSNNILKSKLRSLINRVLVSAIIFLIGLITIKANPNYLKKINKYLYEESIHFSGFKKIYNKFFGKYIGEKEEVKPVFTEKIAYKKDSVYKDGVKLEVSDGYLIPAIEGGIVVYIGEKEGYGNTVIIEQINGISTWYSNVDAKNIKLYDYIKKGDLIGEAKNKKLYLLFEKKGKFLDYKKYI